MNSNPSPNFSAPNFCGGEEEEDEKKRSSARSATSATWPSASTELCHHVLGGAAHGCGGWRRPRLSCVFLTSIKLRKREARGRSLLVHGVCISDFLITAAASEFLEARQQLRFLLLQLGILTQDPSRSLMTRLRSSRSWRLAARRRSTWDHSTSSCLCFLIRDLRADSLFDTILRLRLSSAAAALTCFCCCSSSASFEVELLDQPGKTAPGARGGISGGVGMLWPCVGEGTNMLLKLKVGKLSAKGTSKWLL